MSDTKERLQRARSQFPPPEGVMEALRRRRDRKRRNQRIRAGVLGLAIAVAVGWLGVNAIRSTPSVPADDPTPTLPELRRDGEIIVSSGTESGWDLAAQDPETGEVRKIVETDGIVDCPGLERCTSFVERAEWSADGRWVAFEVSYGILDMNRLSSGPCGPTAGVWVQGPVGAPRQLTRPCEATPGADGLEELWAWSPVGARLAYTRVDGEDDKLFVIDPSDGSRTLHLSGGGDRTALEWSPDGTRIAVASEGEGVLEVGVDPGGLWELEDSFEDVIEIDYSPDGTQIMVHDQGRYRIQVMNADGSDLHLLLEGEDACCETEWSPNGNRILYQLTIYHSGAPFDSQVWTVSPDGSNRIKVFDSEGCGDTPDTLPVWAPNGTQVAYNACGSWVVSNADGTGEPQPIDELVHRSWAGGWLSGWDLL